MERFQLHAGDCIAVMRGMADASVDSIVTDPPYELGFMGKAWDSTGIANSVEMWREALRVLKPGGHLLAFSGSRTYHRMVVAIEDAGFEIRDQIMWLYGSGFPKSLDVSKAIDKVRDDSAEGLALGAWLKAQREARGFKQKDVAALWPSATGGLTGCVANWETLGKVPKWDQWLQLKAFIGFGDEMDAEVWRLNGRKGTPGNEREDREVSAPASNEVFQPTQRVINAGTPVLDAARQWQGWGTALKPAHEPIVVARKPLIGTVASNVLMHGTGAINIDRCRIATSESLNGGAYAAIGGREVSASLSASGMNVPGKVVGADFVQPEGRWPANVIHDGSAEVVSMFPEASGQSGAVTGEEPSSKTNAVYGEFNGRPASQPRGDMGSAARFFYCAKTSSEDRHEGLPMPGPQFSKGSTLRDAENLGTSRKGNFHPTVKPTDLMRYLCRLVTPPGGLVLDPFMGSGSTGKAAVLEGFRFIGIDLEAAHVAIAQARIDYARRQGFQNSLLLEAA